MSNENAKPPKPMTCIFNYTGMELVQKAGMKKPDTINVIGTNVSDAEYETVDELKEKYEQHLASLKRYPCSWLTESDHGKEFVKGVDFKVWQESGSNSWYALPNGKNGDDVKGKLTQIRNEFYDSIKANDLSAWDCVVDIKKHLTKLDKFIDELPIEVGNKTTFQ